MPSQVQPVARQTGNTHQHDHILTRSTAFRTLDPMIIIIVINRYLPLRVIKKPAHTCREGRFGSSYINELLQQRAQGRALELLPLERHRQREWLEGLATVHAAGVELTKQTKIRRHGFR